MDGPVLAPLWHSRRPEHTQWRDAMRKTFTNEPFTDFSVAENAAAFRPRLND